MKPWKLFYDLSILDFFRKEGWDMPNRTSNYSGSSYSRVRRRRKITKTVLLCLLVAFIAFGIVAMVMIFTTPPQPPANNGQSTDTPVVTDPIETEPHVEGFEVIEVDLSQLNRGDLVLVSGEHEYKALDDYELLEIYYNRKKYDGGARAYQLSGIDLKLADFVLRELNAMNEAFYEESGLGGLLIKSAYRTRQEQKELYDARVAKDGVAKAEKYVAKPGHSEHETGLAFDMSVYVDGENTYISDEPEYRPIYSMAYKYGFILRYAAHKVAITGINYESWHFRYVGMPHAYYMTENDLCLEEYIDLLRRQYKDSDVHLRIDAPDRDGKVRNYEVYFVPADTSKGKNEVIVPVGYQYEISGNNVDGYIVTVDLNSQKK